MRWPSNRVVLGNRLPVQDPLLDRMYEDANLFVPYVAVKTRSIVKYIPGAHLG